MARNNSNKSKIAALNAPEIQEAMKKFASQMLGAIKTSSQQSQSDTPDSNQAEIPHVTPSDFFTEMQRMMLQTIVNAEMDAFLGRAKYERKKKQADFNEVEAVEQAASDGANTANDSADEAPADTSSSGEPHSSPNNYRNGSYKRTVSTTNGDYQFSFPRDRNSEFNSMIIPKGVRDISGLQDKILELAAAGNSCQACARIIHSMLNIEVSHTYIHYVVQAYQERLEQWRKRDFKPFYPFLFVDCLYVPVRGEDDKVTQRAVYVVLGIDTEGHKELLHLHIGNGSEGKSEWLNIFSELQSRGLQDILFLCIDGVSGVEEGVKAIFPKVKVQRCMVHLMRNSCEYVGTKARKDFCADAKRLYQSHNADEAKEALKELKNKWQDTAPGAVRVWERHFESHVLPLYDYPQSIRKVIYTTNAIESVNSSLRKVVKKGCFNSNDSVVAAMLLRADKVLSTNWERRAIPNWASIKNALLVNKGTEELMVKYCSNGAK